MSLEYFHLIKKEPIDKSIIKRDLLKVYHQQGADLNRSYQNVELIFGEKNYYHKIGNSYLEFDITVRKDDHANFTKINAIRLTRNALAYVFEEARLSTTTSGDLEHNKLIGQLSTNVRAVKKDADLLSQFDNINESNGNTDFDSISLKKYLLTTTM